MSYLSHRHWRIWGLPIGLVIALAVVGAAFLVGDRGEARTVSGLCVTFEMDESELKEGLLHELVYRIRRRLGQNSIRHRELGVEDGRVGVTIRDSARFDEALDVAQEFVLPVPGGRGDDATVTHEGQRIFLSPSRPALDDLVTAAMAHSTERMKSYMVEANISGYSIRVRDRTKMKVRIPGIASFDEVRPKYINGHVQFEMILLAPSDLADNPKHQKGSGKYRALKGWKDRDRTFLVRRRTFASGEDLVTAKAIRTWRGTPAIRVQMNSTGADRLRKRMAANADRRVAFILSGWVFATSDFRADMAGGVFDIFPDATADEIEELARALRLSFRAGPITLVEEKACSWRSRE